MKNKQFIFKPKHKTKCLICGDEIQCIKEGVSAICSYRNCFINENRFNVHWGGKNSEDIINSL